MIRIYLLITLLVSSSFSQNKCFHKSYSRISEKKCEEYKDLIAKITKTVGSLLPQPETCGTKTYECGSVGQAGLIVGGKPAKVGEFPHMAALGWRLPGGIVQFNCGGSLISERFVLTAAHCSQNGLPSFVRLGMQNLADAGPSSAPDEVDVKKFIKHPDYDSVSNSHDIALIELVRNVVIHNTHLRPACLQQEEYRDLSVTATGWGKLGTYNDTSDMLMKVVLPVNSIRVCRKLLSNKDLQPTRQICAGGERGKDTCRGDSGCPIQSAYSDEVKCVYNVIGVTSYGTFFCGKKAPAVYTKVKYYLDWIEDTVWPGQYV